jgi:hypothetical protein
MPFGHSPPSTGCQPQLSNALNVAKHCGLRWLNCTRNPSEPLSTIFPSPPSQTVAPESDNASARLLAKSCGSPDGIEMMPMFIPCGFARLMICLCMDETVLFAVFIATAKSFVTSRYSLSRWASFLTEAMDSNPRTNVPMRQKTATNQSANKSSPFCHRSLPLVSLNDFHISTWWPIRGTKLATQTTNKM